MENFRERIAEMVITEWTGARVQVSIELPRLHNSLTTMMVIDDRDLDMLRNLKKPADLELLDDTQKHFALVEWGHKQADARRFADMLASKIAMQICHAVGEEI